MAHPLNVVFVFPGHGSQYVGMGRDVYGSFPEARAVFDEADTTLGFSVSRLCFEGPAKELCLPFNVQPALLTFSMALLAVMRRSPSYISPSYAAGHSLGEYTALAAAGVLNMRDALKLTRKRGQFMYQVGAQKACAAAVIIGLADDAVLALACDAGVFVANYNYPGQVVVSGERSNVDKAINKAKERGAIKTVPIAGSVAFHSPLMQSATDRLTQALSEVHFNHPKFSVIGNTSASPIASFKDELVQQLCNPVQWSKSMSYLISHGADLFVEIGPGNVLSNLMKRIDKYAKVANISDANTLTEYLRNGLTI
ncbi:MAG: ACP S-malonyltransferase [Dehalococcoidia bacterium]|nr:ACP S-malonyltransferase [Dehalococcoidia bacterium]